jgi:hypothetical protein
VLSLKKNLRVRETISKQVYTPKNPKTTEKNKNIFKSAFEYHVIQCKRALRAKPQQ